MGVLKLKYSPGPLYFGGVPDIPAVSARVGVASGFVGCVKQLNIDGKSYDFRQQPRGTALSGVDVADCTGGVCRRAR